MPLLTSIQDANNLNFPEFQLHQRPASTSHSRSNDRINRPSSPEEIKSNNDVDDITAVDDIIAVGGTIQVANDVGIDDRDRSQCFEPAPALMDSISKEEGSDENAKFSHK